GPCPSDRSIHPRSDGRTDGGGLPEHQLGALEPAGSGLNLPAFLPAFLPPFRPSRHPFPPFSLSAFQPFCPAGTLPSTDTAHLPASARIRSSSSSPDGTVSSRT